MLSTTLRLAISAATLAGLSAYTSADSSAVALGFRRGNRSRRIYRGNVFDTTRGRAWLRSGSTQATSSIVRAGRCCGHYSGTCLVITHMVYTLSRATLRGIRHPTVNAFLDACRHHRVAWR